METKTKVNRNRTGKMAALSLAVLTSLYLGGCGGSGNGGGGTTPPPSGGNDGGNNGGNNPPPSISTGVFLDAPVEGLAYTASPSGRSGFTNGDGEFEYQAGDTVTFSIGELVLGSVPAQSVVTPTTVAEAIVAANPDADPETVTVNLLVFLQSLDVDGDPSNGIELTAELSNAVSANAINFAVTAADFTSSLNTLVAGLENAVAGLDLKVVNRDQAVEHFVGQASELVAGTYVWADAGGNAVIQNTRTLTLFQNGRYLYGGHDEDPDCNGGPGSTDENGNGVELGNYEFNPLTGEIRFTSTFETNGSCGPHTEEGQSYKLDIQGDLLVMDVNEAQPVYWVKVPSVANQITGSWVDGRSLLVDLPHVVTFFSTSANGRSGRFFVADSLSYEVEDEGEENPGIEEGCYSLDEEGYLTVDLNPATCPGAIDTNADAGLSGSIGLRFELDEHGRLMYFDEETGAGLLRLPLKPVTQKHLIGSRYFDLGTGYDPTQAESFFLLSMFDNGKFLFGIRQSEEDGSCNTSTYPMPYQDSPDGVGIEYGTMNFVEGAYPGVVRIEAVTDTNGECGLHDATNDGQRFMLVRSAGSDKDLLLYTADDDEEGGFVLKGVPSVENSLTGAWLRDDATDELARLLVFFDNGVVFTMAADAGFDSGVARYGYSVEDGKLVLTNAIDACVDTIGTTDSCEDDPFTEESTFSVDGNELQLDADSYIKVTAP